MLMVGALPYIKAARTHQEELDEGRNRIVIEKEIHYGGSCAYAKDRNHGRVLYY